MTQSTPQIIGHVKAQNDINYVIKNCDHIKKIQWDSVRESLALSQCKIYYDDSGSPIAFATWNDKNPIDHQESKDTEIYFSSLVAPSDLIDRLLDQLAIDFRDEYECGLLLDVDEQRLIEVWDNPSTDRVEIFLANIEEGFAPYDRDEFTCLLRFSRNEAHMYLAKASCGTLQTRKVSSSERNENLDAVVNISSAGLDFLIDYKEDLDLRHPRFTQEITEFGDFSAIGKLLSLSFRPCPTTKKVLKATKKKSVLAEFSGKVLRYSLKNGLRKIKNKDLALPFVIIGIDEFWPACGLSKSEIDRRLGSTVIWSDGKENTITISNVLYPEPSQNDDIEFYSKGGSLPSELRSDFPPFFCDEDSLIQPQLWFGSVEDLDLPLTSLHRDCTIGFLGQVIGTKRVDIFPPHFEDFLYPAKAYNVYQPCLHDPTYRYDDRFPLSQLVNSISFELGPGEMLVQPPGWFHSVYAQDSVVLSVSYFSKRSCTLEMLGERPLKST